MQPSFKFPIYNLRQSQKTTTIEESLDYSIYPTWNRKGKRKNKQIKYLHKKRGIRNEESTPSLFILIQVNEEQDENVIQYNINKFDNQITEQEEEIPQNLLIGNYYGDPEPICENH